MYYVYMQIMLASLHMAGPVCSWTDSEGVYLNPSPPPHNQHFPFDSKFHFQGKFWINLGYHIIQLTLAISTSLISNHLSRSETLSLPKYDKNSAEGVIAPAGAKVTGATIRMWLLNKFISFLAALTWKTGLKKNVDKVPSGAHIFQASPIPSNGYIFSTDFSYHTAQ